MSRAPKGTLPTADPAAEIYDELTLELSRNNHLAALLEDQLIRSAG